MTLETGDSVPDVTLPCCDGDDFEDVELADLCEDENILLAFFPLAFSSVCTDEMCNFDNMLNRLDEFDTQVYGISVDSPFTLNEFIQKEDLSFPLLSDFNREAVDAFGVREQELLGLESVARRSVFLIDKNGTIQYAWDTEDASNHPDYEAIEEHAGGLS